MIWVGASDMGIFVTALEKEENRSSSATQRARKILIVDDSKLQRRILSTMLKNWGYLVSEAPDAQDALQQCAQYHPDIVISDWVMPGMDGPEFCRAFKQMARDTYGYFILLTSKSDKEEVAHGLESGADDFLTKPVNSSEMRARIVAGERVLHMEDKLKEKNALLSETLGELQRLYDAIDQDLIEAKHLQQSLLRERYRDFGPAQISLFLQSSGHVGGDLVGFFPAGDHHIGFYSIDVSGHGISSALMTARMDGYLSSANPEQNIALGLDANGAICPKAPSDVLRHLNQLVLDEMETEHYLTIMLGNLDMRTGEVIAAQGGHPHPALICDGSAKTLLGPGGLPIGLLEGAEHEEMRFVLSPGEKLLICSDGVTECDNAAGLMLDDAGLVGLIRHLPSHDGRVIFDHLIDALAKFAGRTQFDDDVSGLCLEYQGSV